MKNISSSSKIAIYRGSGGGSSSTGMITIYDEGVLVGPTTILDFIGGTVSAQAGSGKVNVYIPPPAYVSHFNTSDGTTNATLGSIGTTARNVAGPTSEGVPYKTGSWIAGTSHPTITAGTLVYSTAGLFSILNNSSTTLTARMWDADGISVIASHVVTLTGNYDVTTDNIRIQVMGFATNGSKYQANITITYYLSLILPTGGRFSVSMVHADGGDGTFSKTQNDIFYDTNQNAATQTGLTLAETAGQVQTLHISGVEYYTINSQFTVQIADLDYLNDRSYPNTQVEIMGAEYGLPALSLTGSDLTGWTNLWNDTNDTYSKVNWAISLVNYFNVSTTANISSRTIDWAPSAWLNSADNSVCICTYVDNSTRIYEDFRLENNRLLSNLVTAWDATQFLTTYDSATGLQFFSSRLIFPSMDFTSYNPNPGSQPNYTGFAGSGDLLFYRRMWHTGTSHSNGLFNLSDYNLTEAEFNNKDVIIQLSLNGTVWFLLNDLYPGGAIGDGDGCRINEDIHGLPGATTPDNQLQFTFGTGKNTDITTGGGWGVYIKITYKDNAVGRVKYIGVLQIIDWV